MIRMIQGRAASTLLAVALLAGCEAAPRTQPLAGPVLAPYTAVTNPQYEAVKTSCNPSTPLALSQPGQPALVLPPVAAKPVPAANPAAQDQFVMDQLATAYGRSEKSVLSNQPLYRYSAYSEYTVDAQSIGPALGGPGSGYRYRYVSRGAVTFP